MKSLFSFCFLLGALPALAQEPAPADALGHLTIVRGQDNPNAIPIHFVTVEMLISLYGRENSQLGPAAERFASRFDADLYVAEAMVVAIRQAAETIQAKSRAQRVAFCERNFNDKNAWIAANVSADAEGRNFRVAEFNRLRDIAGPAVWDNIVLMASQARRGVSIVTEDYESSAAETPYEAIFTNQCSGIIEEQRQ